MDSLRRTLDEVLSYSDEEEGMKKLLSRTNKYSKVFVYNSDTPISIFELLLNLYFNYIAKGKKVELTIEKINLLQELASPVVKSYSYASMCTYTTLLMDSGNEIEDLVQEYHDLRYHSRNIEDHKFIKNYIYVEKLISYISEQYTSIRGFACSNTSSTYFGRNIDMEKNYLGIGKTLLKFANNSTIMKKIVELGERRLIPDTKNYVLRVDLPVRLVELFHIKVSDMNPTIFEGQLKNCKTEMWKCAMRSLFPVLDNAEDIIFQCGKLILDNNGTISLTLRSNILFRFRHTIFQFTNNLMTNGIREFLEVYKEFESERDPNLKSEIFRKFGIRFVKDYGDSRLLHGVTAELLDYIRRNYSWNQVYQHDSFFNLRFFEPVTAEEQVINTMNLEISFKHLIRKQILKETLTSTRDWNDIFYTEGVKFVEDLEEFGPLSERDLQLLDEFSNDLNILKQRSKNLILPSLPIIETKNLTK